MIFGNSKRLLLIAFLLMLFGIVMPFLMVIHVVESTFFLNFLSFGASMLGLVLGIVAVASGRVERGRKDNNDEDRYK
jgi:hypothetical protein